MAIFRCYVSFRECYMLFGFKNQQFQHGPTKAHHVLRISPLSGPSQLPLEGHLDMACQWRHATLARNGVLFAMPWQATAVLRVEPSLAKVRQLGSLPVTQQGKFGFTVAAQERRCGWGMNGMMVLMVKSEWIYRTYMDVHGRCLRNMMARDSGNRMWTLQKSPAPSGSWLNS